MIPLYNSHCSFIKLIKNILILTFIYGYAQLFLHIDFLSCAEMCTLFLCFLKEQPRILHVLHYVGILNSFRLFLKNMKKA